MTPKFSVVVLGVMLGLAVTAPAAVTANLQYRLGRPAGLLTSPRPIGRAAGGQVSSYAMDNEDVFYAVTWTGVPEPASAGVLAAAAGLLRRRTRCRFDGHHRPPQALYAFDMITPDRSKR